jgi:hypothetical protein
MEDNSENPVRRAYRRYFVELGLAMVLYVGVLFGRNWLLYGTMANAEKSEQIAVAVTPLVPVIWVFFAIVRLVRNTDELQRRMYVNSLAIAGGATALLAATYGFMEGEYFPLLSAWWTYAVFMSAWLIAGFFVKRSYR